MKKIIIFFIFVSLFSFDLSYMKAFRYFNKGLSLINSDTQNAQNYFTKSFNLLKNIKNKNNSGMHYMLGRMYLNGWGVNKNYQKALKEFLTAEKLGNKRVHCSLLKLYVKTKNKQKAQKELNYVLTHKNLDCKIDKNILKEIK